MASTHDITEAGVAVRYKIYIEKKKKPNRKRKADAPSSANRKKKGSK